MLKADLYEELNREHLGYILCPKEKLKDNLQQISESLHLGKDSLIIRICEEGYKIYYSEKDTSKECELIRLDLALRFRVELDICELQQKMRCVDEAAKEYPFDVVTDKYCLVRYMDLSDDFLILDVYVGVEDRESEYFFATGI